MRHRWASHIFSLLSCCGLRTSSNKTSYACRDAVRNLLEVRSERGTDRHGVLYDIPYNCRVVQWAFRERSDVGFVDPLADNVSDRLAQGQGHGRPVGVRSTHIIGDKKRALDMISVNSGVVKILTQAVRTL